MHAIKDSRSLLIATLFSATAFACGGGTSFSAGVDGNKQVKDLTDSDAQTLCKAAEETANDFFDDNKDGFCKFSGAFAGIFAGSLGGDAQSTCEMAVTQCESQASTEPAMCEPMVTDCEATIAEIEACYNDSLDVAADLLDKFAGKSCADLIADESSLNITADTPASCVALEEKCPSLEFGNVSVGTSSTAG
ncbi:MAG: hypothetical protein RMA76_01335 [Deltaproteobacteria bacterium]|jgi:hypothetical protein